MPAVRRTLHGRLALVACCAGVLVVVAGCSNEPGSPPTATVQRFAVCVGPTEARPAGQQMALEFRQAGQLVATGSIPVGGTFMAQVPVGTDIDVYADGEWAGGGGAAPGALVEGDRGYVYVSGPGCPSEPPTS